MPRAHKPASPQAREPTSPRAHSAAGSQARSAVSPRPHKLAALQARSRLSSALANVLVRERQRPSAYGGSRRSSQVGVWLDARELGALDQAVEQRSHLGAAF